MSRVHERRIGDSLQFIEEIGAKSTDPKGETNAERVQKSDGNTESSVAYDKGEDYRFSADQKQHPDKFQEEQVVVARFFEKYNELNSGDWILQAKTAEDYKFPDAVIKSKGSPPRVLNIEVRHLDDTMAGQIGRSGSSRRQYDVAQIREMIVEAIKNKARKKNYSGEVKNETILLLQLSVPIGDVCAGKVQDETFEFEGFKEVWICPFHEGPFAVRPRI